MVKANTDKMIDLLRNKNPMSVAELSKQLAMSKDDIEKSAIYLEDDGVVKIEHKFPNTLITLVKDPEMEKIEIQLGQESDEAYMPPPPPPEKNVLTNSDEPVRNITSSTQEETIQPVPEPVSEPVPEPNPVLNLPPEPDLQQEIQPELKPEPQPDPVTDTNLFSSPEIEEENNIIPEPEEQEAEIIKENIKSPLQYSDEFSNSSANFPEYADTSVDKIDFLITQANDLIINKDFTELNNLYRKIYAMYNETEDLTGNEKYLIADKINALFDRIKRIYIIEKIK